MSKLQWLRHIVGNLKSVEIQPGPMTADSMNAAGFVRARLSSPSLGVVDSKPSFVGIKQEARGELYKFVDSIFSESNKYQRAITFKEAFDHIANCVIEKFFGRDVHSITNADVASIEKITDAWFHSQIQTHTLYIPSAITRVKSSPFSVGPISFEYLDEFCAAQQQRFPKMFDMSFGRLATRMRQERAFWVAKVEVPECGQRRAQELGDLAVDLAIVGLQLVIPFDRATRMTRMTARTLTCPRDFGPMIM